MKKLLAVLLVLWQVIPLHADTWTGDATRQERNAPPLAHFEIAGAFAILAIVERDSTLKYQERAANARATGRDASSLDTHAARLRFRTHLATAIAATFLVTGGVRLVMDDGLFGFRKDIRFGGTK